MRCLRMWWPVVAWAAVISWFSTETFTSDNTGKIIIPALHWLLPNLPQETLAFLHFVIRKCGHFVEYFVLSLLVLRGLRAGRTESHLKWAVTAVLVVAGYAAVDEWHQSFVPGRTAAVGDVLLDTTGGAAAQAVAALAFSYDELRRRRQKMAVDEGFS
jgi:VanZ family protein